MSKAKIEKSVKTVSSDKFPIEIKSKKKLNKRQREIKKKIRNKKELKLNKNTDELKLNKNLKSEELKKNEINKQNISITPEQPKISKKDEKVSGQNSEIFSSNWTKLKESISKSKKESSQNSKNWKRKVEKKPAILNINGSNTCTTEMANINKKPLVTEPVRDAISIKYDVEGQKNNGGIPPYSLKSENSFSGATKVIAIDCEMVGGGLKGETDILARVSIVNQYGNVLYDKYVTPREDVVDYRTEFSGIRPENLVNAESFEVVQKEVSKLLSGRIVVGHGVKNDFHCLYISHPKNLIRDTSKYKPFRKTVGRGTPSLKRLSEKILGIKIQSGEHDSIQDAQAAMRLYTIHKKKWEREVPNIKTSRHKSN